MDPAIGELTDSSSEISVSVSEEKLSQEKEYKELEVSDFSLK